MKQLFFTVLLFLMITGCKTKQGVISTDNKNMSTKSTMDLVKEAKEQIENLTPQQVKQELLSGAT